ncbi:hypothetical protein [Sunxiuqinia elliptica]|uniref:NigD-like protein n=1 Tax=Sunxiuqinia elliptica TaxID=655355 RepID=A0A1I2EIU5_9BACT|nr:NigD-like C-terminal domain-containing protein [Sunxiuqinia elliptica]SFE93014.1 NigD-like protein [Sunxiuqinia elliptica]
MSKSLYFIALLALIFVGCNQSDFKEDQRSKGTVAILGTLDCSVQIELENGDLLLPQNWTDFKLVSGDEVEIDYRIIGENNRCGGSNCLLTNVSVIKNASLEAPDYIDLYVSNYDSLKNDPVTVSKAYIEDDKLIVELSYGGGCTEHSINLVRVHGWCATPPIPPPSFQIRHDANNDDCEAWISKTYQFDISRLQEGNESPVKISFSASGYGDDYFHTNLIYNYE